MPHKGTDVKVSECRRTNIRSEDPQNLNGQMGQNEEPTAGQHEHCRACFRVQCRVPLAPPVSCATISCQLLCGAIFHRCKEEEHRMLCPRETVPCLNADYGCPFTLPRCRLARHLQACPASLVTCSLDWNRWPATEADAAFCRSVVADCGSGEPLDLAVALRDQRLLFSNLKLDALFPELMQPAEMVTEEAQKAASRGPIRDGGSSELEGELLDISKDAPEVQELTQEERDALAKSREVARIDNYKAWESIFSKELRGYQWEPQEQASSLAVGNGNQEKAERNTRQLAEGAESTPRNGSAGATGLAPWQDGVLERLGKEVNIAEYNMYLVHHGSMLIHFGQLEACTPRERDFVYGALEPIEVETVHSYSVPSSYRAKRSFLKNSSLRMKRSTKETDTFDLEVSVEDIPKCDEVKAMLVCSLEQELRGHPISKTVPTDGLFVDIGTQTYDFASAPFRAGATLADITAGRTLSLHVQIQAESVTRRHNKASSIFTFLCGHTFRRDEFAWHFRNVHSDLCSVLDGWFQQRCPLAYLGCTYRQTRFQPSTHRATVTYDGDSGTFTVRPQVPPELLGGARGPDGLSKLPLEVLQSVASYLDSFSLSQLSQVSRLMRDVCATLLQDRGMVSLRWERETDPDGKSSWRNRVKVWQFSSSFSAVQQWRFDDMPSMAEHLRACPFYETEERSRPVALVGLSDGPVCLPASALSLSGSPEP
uniref:F-box protein 40 n=2 Tax=Paramormyrops kingsleyae TaxID=1676925 RepID=A0A3B3SWP5_9TELE|nr:F-box only protein 40-like [Paramormyrops kingsleyae]